MTSPPNIELILERQMKLWEARQRLFEQGGESARAALVHLHQGPWLAVSRQLGSGGVEIAARAAERFGWQLFDRQILSTIAAHTHARETVLSQFDEHAIGTFHDYLRQLLVPDQPGQAQYLHEMMHVVWGLAGRGKAVIVGRGANWFLDPRYGLRLRVVAPVAKRVERLAHQEGIDRQEAERRVRENDDEQRAFIHQVFARNIDDPQGYDLVINTEWLEVDGAAAVVITALGRKLDPS